MINPIELVVCAAVVVSLLLEAFPRVAEAIEHGVVVTLVTIAAWPMYVAIVLWPPMRRPPAHP